MLRWTKEKFVKTLQKKGIDQENIDKIQMADSKGGVRYRIEPGTMDFETEVKIDDIVDRENAITNIQRAALVTAASFGVSFLVCTVADFVKGRRLKRNLKKQLKEEALNNNKDDEANRIDDTDLDVNEKKN
jgi:hypothetical protein